MEALPNWRQRWCTRILKIEPFAEYLKQQVPCTTYVGIRADEEEREGGDYSKVLGVIARFPMREWGWTIDDVVSFNSSKGIVIPKRTDCAVCFFQRIHEWYELWRDNPEQYQQGIAWEEATGHTFRSPGRDTWPAALKDLAKEFEARRRIRGYKAGDPQMDLFGPDKIADMKCRVCRL